MRSAVQGSEYALVVWFLVTGAKTSLGNMGRRRARKLRKFSSSWDSLGSEKKNGQLKKIAVSWLWPWCRSGLLVSLAEGLVDGSWSTSRWAFLPPAMTVMASSSSSSSQLQSRKVIGPSISQALAFFFIGKESNKPIISGINYTSTL